MVKDRTGFNRRKFLQTSALGAVAAATGIVAAPSVLRAQGAAVKLQAARPATVAGPGWAADRSVPAAGRRAARPVGLLRPARATAAAIPTGAGSSTAGSGMVSSASGRVAVGSTGSGATAGGGRTRRWMLWPAWMTQASPGWAWRTASGSMRGRSPMRALAKPPGAVVVQLPVVLQHPHLAGQGQQPLGVRALVDDDPAGAGGQQPGRLAVVAEALDALGGDHDLDADVADALGQVDGASPRPRPGRRTRPGRAGRPRLLGVCGRWRSGRSPPAPPAWPHPPRSWTTGWGR